MKKYYLLTAFGKDRPGIVAGVTGVLFEHGANLEDASMTRIGGEFSMMLVLALPTGVSAPRLEKSFRGLERKMGVQVSVKPIPSAVARRSKGIPAQYLITVYGADRPGIVYGVTRALAERKVSVTDLQTKVIGSAKKPVYMMLLEVQVPASLDMDDLRSALDQLRQDLQVEISLQDIEAVSL
jgi:glycine cleavage system transcriptional repressor